MKRILLFICSVIPFVFLSAQQTSLLDTTFGEKGIFQYDALTAYYPKTMKVLPDDGILILAEVSNQSVTRLMKLKADGSGLDRSFGLKNKGHTTVGNSFGGIGFTVKCNDLAIQPDGKILLACDVRLVRPSTTTELAILRLHANGKIDTAFGDQGFAILRKDGNDQARSIAIAPDGSIYISGDFNYCPGCEFNMAIGKFDATGEVDTTFGKGGWLEEDTNPQVYTGSKLAVQPDGKLVVGARGGVFLGPNNDFEERVKVFRFLPNGQRDSSFAFNGTRSLNYLKTTIFNARVGFSDLLVQDDGKIWLGGDSQAYNIATNDAADWNITSWRLTPDGGIDSTLIGPTTTNPMVPNPITQFYGTKAFMPDSLPGDEGLGEMTLIGDKIWLFGYVEPTDGSRVDERGLIGCMNLDGSPDTTFARNGQFTFKLDSLSKSDYFLAGGMQSDGKLVALLYSEFENDEQVVVIRLGEGNTTAIEPSIEPVFRIYPNPVKTAWTLKSSQPYPHAQLAIYDLTGQRLWRQEQPLAKSTRIAIDHLPLQAGKMYWLRIKAGGSVWSHAFRKE